MIYSVYRLTDGVFTGLQFAAGPEFVAANLPPDCGAWPGAHDAARVRVETATQLLVPYQPPAPADTAWQTWAWDAQAWRWVSTPTAAALAAEARAERGRRLTACDWVVARATELAEPVPAAWVVYRAALRNLPQQPGFPTDVHWPDPPATL